MNATKVFVGFYDKLHPDHIVNTIVTYTKWLIVNFSVLKLTLSFLLLLPKLMHMLKSNEAANVSKTTSYRIAAFHSFLKDLFYRVI